MDLFGLSPKRLGIFCLAILGVAGILEGRQATGELRLQVKDPSGAAVVVSGTLQNSSGGADRTFQTDSQGMARFAALPYGHYRLEISKPGFANLVLTIDMQSPTPIDRVVTLRLAPQASRMEHRCHHAAGRNGSQYRSDCRPGADRHRGRC